MPSSAVWKMKRFFSRENFKKFKKLLSEEMIVPLELFEDYFEDLNLYFESLEDKYE